MAAASRRPSPAPRRVVPIKRADGEPLSRADIQYDFLNAVFSDASAVFTDPHHASKDGESANKVCFRELYISAILHSPKATKALKDKMAESPNFAVDFAMLSLMVNVGRVNTTMSFFPEMKTAIRTYHPIPSLQRTDGNMQDAPRIKHILKTSLLDQETSNPPSTPADIIARFESGSLPSTSVTNLVFVLAHHTAPIAQAHFQGQFDFLDLFLRTELSSSSRANAFLWLCYNYLESPAPSEDEYDEEAPPNPFCDSVKKSSPPSLTFLTPEEVAQENQESAEDIAVTDKLKDQRTRTVKAQGAKEAAKASSKVSVNGSVVGGDDEDASVVVEEPKPKGKKATSTQMTKAKGKRAAATSATEKKEKKVTLTVEKPKEREAVITVPDLDDEEQMLDAYVKQRASFRKFIGTEPFEHPSALFSVLPSQRNGVDHSHPIGHRNRYSPYSSHSPASVSMKDIRARYRRPRHLEPRTMLQQAWHVITSTDALVDSDDEAGGDEYMRDDYLQRLDVIKRFSHPQWSQDQPSYPAEMDTDPL